jgi:isopenicillin-N N-acyltransferase-like protein
MTDNGHLLHGQNWDWIPQVQGAVVHTTEGNGLRTLSFTEAGIFGGKIGFNSGGVALTVNGMTSTDDDWSRLRKPFHARCYEILRCADLDEAVKIVTGAERSCSTNFLISQASRHAVDIEAAPKVCNMLSFQGGVLVHTNHFVNPQDLGIVEPPSDRRPFSCHRRERMTELLASKQPVAIDDLQEFLRDHVEHPLGICRHEDPNVGPEEHYITVTSVIMDTTAKTMWITDGPPCLSKYEKVTLKA